MFRVSRNFAQSFISYFTKVVTNFYFVFSDIFAKLYNKKKKLFNPPPPLHPHPKSNYPNCTKL